MLNGTQEQQWEKFEITKQQVIDVIAEALKLWREKMHCHMHNKWRLPFESEWTDTG